MSVNSVYQRIRATGNGSQVEFSFPWKFIENQDLKVYVNDELKEIDSDYSIVANDKKTSGKIVFNIAPIAGSIIVIKRDGDKQQDKLYNLRNAFDPNNVEYSFDKLTLLVQELADAIRQSPVSESQSGVDWLIDKLDNENGILYVDLENKKIIESDFPITDIVRAQDGMYLRQTQLSNPNRFVFQYSLDGQSWITIGDIGAVARDLEKEIADRIAGDNALQSQIDTYASDISQNTADIAQNTSDISQNTTDIATNKNNIENNAAAITAEVSARENSDISFQSQITSNDIDILALQNNKADRFTIAAQSSFDVLAAGVLVFSDETTITGGYTNSNKLTIDITKAIQFNFSDRVEYVSTDAVGAPQRTLVKWADNENGTYTLHVIDGNDVVANIVTYTESTGAFAWHVASGDITLPISLGWKVGGRINGNWNSAIMAAGHPEVVMNTKDVFNVLRGAVASFADTDNDIYGTIEKITATKIDTIIGGNGVVITGTGPSRTINFNQEAMPKFASTESPAGAINSSFTGLLANLTPIIGITPDVNAVIIFANGYVGVIQSITATGYTAVISSTPVAATFSSLGGVYTDNPSLVGGFDTKQDKIPAGTSGNIVVYSGNQGQFDSVSPANLPISTSVQNALNTKFNSSGGVIIGDTTFRREWTVKASDTATISMSGGVSSQGGTITVVNDASTNVYFFTPTAFWTGNATLGRAGGWSWENVYTKLINNGGDIIVPTTSGTMALVSDVTSATSNKADKSTDFVTPITSANKGLTEQDKAELEEQIALAAGTGRNIGDIFWTTRTDSALNGAVECNGGTYNTADYTGDGSIGELLESGKLPYVSLAQYASLLTTNSVCGVFGWDGTGTTTFRVPTLQDVFIECGQVSELGDYIPAGLPNITGTAGVYWTEAVKYRAMIQLFNGTTDEAVATVGTVVAQVGELNTHRVIEFQAPTAENGHTWYRKYADGWVEQGGYNSSVSDLVNTTLPIEMSSSVYNIQTQALIGSIVSDNTTVNRNAARAYIRMPFNQTATGFSFIATNDMGQIGTYWQVSGMSAQ